MTIPDEQIAEIERIVSPLLGKEAWGVELGYGSFLTLEFGNPSGLDAPDHRPHGEWHLWIMHAAWQLATETSAIVGSEDPRPLLMDAAVRLNGARLRSVSIEPEGFGTSFAFDSGRSVRAFPISFREDYVHWELFMPGNRVLVVGPGLEWTVKPADPRKPVST